MGGGMREQGWMRRRGWGGAAIVDTNLHTHIEAVIIDVVMPPKLNVVISCGVKWDYSPMRKVGCFQQRRISPRLDTVFCEPRYNCTLTNRAPTIAP